MKSGKSVTPTRETIIEAHERIRPHVHRTPVFTSQAINRMSGADLFFKCENFQKVGAFKARGATNCILSLSSEQLVHGVATHSSGNHAQALSWAASLAKTMAYVVMPTNSNPVKVNAVKEYGGKVTFCESTLAARESTLKEVLKKTGATEVHPYNNLLIIAGQATAACELLEEVHQLDIVMAPVGGGGLLSGTALACHYFSPETKVVGAEPFQANDACLSFTTKKFVPSINPTTIADGLKTSLGSFTFPIILDHVTSILTAREETIIEAMRLIWERMKILVEPSAAVPVAALLENSDLLKNKRIGIILSGGNIDLNTLPWIKS